MVISLCVSLPGVIAGWVLAQTERPLFLRLEPEDRVRVVAALAGLIILGFAMVLLVSWGARATRRYMNRPVHSPRSGDPQVDDWAKKPLIPSSDAWNGESTEPHE
jgi:hypothetical protein